MKKIFYAKEQMTSFLRFSKFIDVDFRKNLKRKKLLCCLHITKETGVFALELKEKGVDILLVSSNPLSTDEDVVNELKSQGINTYWCNKDSDSLELLMLKALEFKPDYVIDDGGDLIALIHKNKINILGACEETTSGINQEVKLENSGKLNFPIVAVNNARTKNLMDNHFGTGQSTLDGIIRSSQQIIAGKKIVICGYGHCGSGIAERSKGLGANVSIVEVDPIKVLQAFYAGFEVGLAKDLFPNADIIITATGCIDVVTSDHLKELKDGCIIANAGHSNVEINIKALKESFTFIDSVGNHLDVYELNNKKIYLLGKGRIINLVAANGHPSEIMSMSYASQLAGLYYVMSNDLKNNIYELPSKFEDEIARIHLSSKGYNIDVLTKAQKEYLFGEEKYI
jgi:adenosylhomocysteinase